MSLKRLRALIDRRVRYRITRGGALFILALTLIGAAAFWSSNNPLFLIFSAMLAVLLVSGFLSRLVLSGLEIELLLPEHVCARAPTPARIRIRNLKRLTPSFSIELAGRPSGPERMPSIFAGSVYFPLIPGGASVEAGIEVTFQRRGRHRENLFALSTRFPFGFIRKSATVMLHRETIVYPAVQGRGEIEVMLENIEDAMEAGRSGSGLDFYRIRPYEPNDSARLVDWKSTAHTGGLQVREFTRDEKSTAEIVFDRRIPPARYGWFEQAVEDCAFAAWTLAGREVEVRFATQGRSFEIPLEEDVYALLRYLALLEPLSPEKRAPDPPGSGAEARIVFSLEPGLPSSI